jgi:hypothetical protein
LTVKRKKVKASDLPEFDAAEYLDSDEAVAEYLTAVLAENDPALLAAALGDIARERHERNREVDGPRARIPLQGATAGSSAAVRHGVPSLCCPQS